MISFGTVFLELVFGQLDRLPGPGEEVFTDEFAVSCGGAVTSAAAAAAAGVRAGVCTRLGDDLGSQVVTEHCAATGVDLSASVQVTGAAAGITVVLNFDGDRGFVTHLPGRDEHEPEVTRWLGVLAEHQPAWCYLHAGRAVPPLLRQARDQGSRVMLDISLGDERDRDAVVECVRLADVFVPNADELLALTGTASLDEAVAAASAWGTPLVVTQGAAGAVVWQPGTGVTRVLDGVADVTVRDLTGAGDNFAGAMVGALIGGASLAEAAVSGNAAGSRSVGWLGAVGEIGPNGAGAGWPLRSIAAGQAAAVLAASGRPGSAGQP
ncbi:MAG TPA: carbohydrate kinase family protein [Streptosporangiaceae bacterium]